MYTMEWTPLQSVAFGTVIQPFSPLEKLTSSNRDLCQNFETLTPGDQVLVIETNGKWARGYARICPKPRDFSSGSVSVDRLPELDNRLIVFPFSIVQILKEFPLPEKDQTKPPENVVVPSIWETEEHRYKPVEPALTDKAPECPHVFSDQNSTIIDEVKSVMTTLLAQTYALYSMGEFQLSAKLAGIYSELDTVQLQLGQDLLTKYEKKIARQTVAFLFASISKLLTTRGNSTRFVSVDSENRDEGGFEAILSRDGDSGELYNLKAKVSDAGSLAQNQVLNAVAPHYPLTEIEEFGKRKSFEGTAPSHILIDFKQVCGSALNLPKGYDGLTAYMYLRNQRKRLTEAYGIHIPADQALSLDNLPAALYKNISATEVDSGRIYLVAILTEGINITSGKGGLSHIRKGIAAGVSDISRIFSKNRGSLESGKSHRFTIQLYGSYVSSHDNTSLKNVNNGWGELLDRIIAGSGRGVAVNPRAETLVVSIKELRNDVLAGEVGDGTAPKPISAIRTMAFDPIASSYERLYLKLVKVSLGSTTVPTNSFVSVRCRSPNRDLTFSKGKNLPATPFWDFLSVAPSEYVEETIQVHGFPVAPKPHERDVLVFETFVNGESFGSSKVRIREGEIMFESKKGATLEIINQDERVVGLLDLTVHYVGKYYNLDPAVDAILNWKSTDKVHEKEMIASFNKVGLDTLIKHFSKILVNLLEMYHSLEDKAALFEGIVHLLDVVVARQAQYVYLFDSFCEKAEKVNHLPEADLLKMMSSTLSNGENQWNHVGRALCRVSVSLVRLSLLCTAPEDVSSLFKAATSFMQLRNPGIIADQTLLLEFSLEWTNLLQGILSDEERFDMLGPLLDSVGKRGLRDRKTGVQTSKEHQIIIAKLVTARTLVESWHVEGNCRISLTFSCIHWSMEALMGGFDVQACRLACGILMTVCESTLQQKDQLVGRGIARLMPTLCRIFVRHNKYVKAAGQLKAKRTFTQLFPKTAEYQEHTMESTLNDEKFAELLIEMGTIMVMVCKVIKMADPNGNGIAAVVQESVNDGLLQNSQIYCNNISDDCIFSMLNAVKLLAQSGFFPYKKWLSLHAMFLEGCVSILELLQPIMMNRYIPSVEQSEKFDRLLWGNFLKMCLRISTAKAASLEHLADVPRKACLQITGDLRHRAAVILSEVWDRLAWQALGEDLLRFQLKRFGGYQVEFINYDYSILQDLVLFCLQYDKTCQELGVHMLWSLLVSEWLVSENLLEVEKQCIVGLYEVFHHTSYLPHVEQQRQFLLLLKKTIRIDREDVAFYPVKSFIDRLEMFLSSLNDLSAVPPGDEYDDERTFYRLNISGFLMEVNQPNLLHTFINEMYESNLKRSNHVQAALSLELLAETYSWSTSSVLAPCVKPKFPSQSPFERKEALYKLMASNFTKGKRFEQAVELYKELVENYDKAASFDLKGLSFAHNQLGQLYHSLDTIERASSTFFRVLFIGFGFPESIRSRSFIYEGLPFEHITSIHDRLSKLHPGSRIISDNEEAEKLSQTPPIGKYLHIHIVEPATNLSLNFLNSSITAKLYTENRNVNLFTSSRRLPGSTSLVDLWTEEVSYETFLTFPALMNRSEVSSSRRVTVSPLENAIKAITAKNKELASLELLVQQSSTREHFNDLSRQLAGTVDSPVNGGVGQYRVFFNEEGDQVEMLKSAFKDLVILLDRCLKLHGKNAPPSLRSSHESLVVLFKQNFGRELEEGKENPVHSHFNKAVRSDYSPSVSSRGGFISESSSSRFSSLSGNSGATEKRNALNWRRRR